MQLPSPGSEKELESIDVGDGPGLRQARKEEHGRTTLGDWLVLMGPDGSDHVWNMLMARSAQGLLKFNFESAPPAKTDLEAIELTQVDHVQPIPANRHEPWHAWLRLRAPTAKRADHWKSPFGRKDDVHLS